MDTGILDPATTAVAAVEDAIGKALVAIGELWRTASGDLPELAQATHRLIARTQALHLAVVAELDTRGVAGEVGAIDTRTWLRHTTRATPGAAGETVRMAGALTGEHRQVGEALSEGAVHWDQARAIIDALTALPEAVEAADREWAETFLLTESARHNPEGLRVIGRAIAAAADPDGTLPDEHAVERVRGARFTEHHDGTVSLTWRDAAETLALAQAASTALEFPRPGASPAAEGAGDLADPPIELRRVHLRRADALAEVFAQVLGHGHLPVSRGTRPHLHVTASLDTLRSIDGAPLASLSTGAAISPAALRRLACDADITTITLDEHGVLLSVGRTHRTVTPAIWAALLARDSGCVLPACARPAHMTEAHHIRHWSEGGETSLTNTALLCRRHHTAVHHDGWAIELGPDRHPELRPPAWIDPERAPRRNELAAPTPNPHPAPGRRRPVTGRETDRKREADYSPSAGAPARPAPMGPARG